MTGLEERFTRGSVLITDLLRMAAEVPFMSDDPTGNDWRRFEQSIECLKRRTESYGWAFQVQVHQVLKMRLGPFKSAYNLKKKSETLEHLLAFVDKYACAAETDEFDRMLNGETKEIPVDPSVPSCRFCHEPGHVVKNCHKRKSIVCFKCGRSGHMARKCSQTPRVETIQVGSISEGPIDDRPRCTTKVNDKEFTSIADPGSIITVFPESAVQTDAPIKSFGMADGVSKMYVKGPIKTEFSVNERKFEHEVYTQTAEEGILGADLLKEAKAKIDMANGSVVFPEDTRQEAKSEQPDEKTETKADDVQGKLQAFEEMIKADYADLMEGIGCCDAVKVNIDTGDHKPIACSE